MWKKWLSALLCALMIASCAAAEEADAAWRLAVEDVQVTCGGETVDLDLSLEALIGRENGGYWLQVSVLQSGESMLAAQAQYANDTLAATVDGAEDCLVINEAGVFFEQYGLSAEIVEQTLNRIFAALGVDPAAYLENEFIQDAFGASVSVEALGDGSYRIEEMTFVGASVGLTVSCTPYADGIPFDLSQKNACTYTYREMYPGEGTDILDAALSALANLMADESLQEVMELLTGAQAIEMSAE